MARWGLNGDAGSCIHAFEPPTRRAVRSYSESPPCPPLRAHKYEYSMFGFIRNSMEFWHPSSHMLLHFLYLWKEWFKSAANDSSPPLSPIPMRFQRFRVECLHVKFLHYYSCETCHSSAIHVRHFIFSSERVGSFCFVYCAMVTIIRWDPVDVRVSNVQHALAWSNTYVLINLGCVCVCVCVCWIYMFTVSNQCALAIS